MGTYYYIGLDIHKRTISYCIKAIDGSLIGQGKIEAELRQIVLKNAAGESFNPGGQGKSPFSP